METTLVIITFLTGAAWGPNVQTIPMKDMDSCVKLGTEISKQIISTARSNITGANTIAGESRQNYHYVTVRGASARDLATIKCY